MIIPLNRFSSMLFLDATEWLELVQLISAAVKPSTLLPAATISPQRFRPWMSAGPTEAGRDACPPKHSQPGQPQGLCFT